ncbi:inactive protein RESTRICTED TEV MOVEMENT 2-like [Rhodamnia argentea]|uniref:Inactive protein RESTRICTED TEV MOVEMENT 2-like n=1 Tax=Rhodamnia argentea TaxID=178133 RepID=A0A8B8QVL9_9MYRT|nr:inactive protein RESTRICTED TEV MOVEMENT 2-like [Rhodamnia argentea]
MAARSGTGRSPTSSSSRPSYEDIEPKSAEWKEEKSAHILNVHLPGFVKEQIRVTYDDSSRSFNVQGDRPLGDNRFGRLNKDFAIPDNCKMKDMEGKFQDEVLTITIPKEYVSPFFGPKEATTSAQSAPENAPSVTHKPPAISEPPKVPPSVPPPNGKSLEPNRRKETTGKEMKSANDTDDAKKNKTREGKVGEPEKQLLVNVSVAALVLVALGAYVGYNFACPRSAKD